MNKTQIFKDYISFLGREDRRINGVSPEFAKMHPDWQKMNALNLGCWGCTHCTYGIACIGCKRCKYCIDCKYCTDCIDCIRETGLNRSNNEI